MTIKTKWWLPLKGPFNPDQMAEKYQTLADLIEPYASTDVDETTFADEVKKLIEHAYEQADAVEEFLASTIHSP